MKIGGDNACGHCVVAPLSSTRVGVGIMPMLFLGGPISGADGTDALASRIFSESRRARAKLEMRSRAIRAAYAAAWDSQRGVSGGARFETGPTWIEADSEDI